MARSILEILLNINKTGTGATQAERELSGVEKVTKSLNSVLGVFGLSLVSSKIFEFANASRDAARAQNDAVNALKTASAGVDDYAEAMRLAKEATRGMASEQELASAMSVLFGAGLATSSQEAAQLASAGTVLSGVFESAGASQELFVRLLSSGSQVLFNNFGITSQMVNAKKAEIEATTQLSGEEARMAAIKAVLIEMSVKYQGALSAETIAAKQNEAAQSDFMGAFGQLVNELDRGTGATTKFTTVLGMMTEGAKAWSFTISEALPAINEFMASQENMSAVVGGSTASQEANRAALEETTAATQEAAAATEAAVAAAEDETAALGPLNSSQIAIGQSARGAGAGEEALARGMMAARDAALQQQQTLDAVSARYQGLAALTRTQGAAGRDALEAMAGGSTLNAEEAAALAERKAAQEEAAQESERLFTQSTQSMVKATNELGSQISSAVSGAVSQSSADIAKLLGITPEGEARVNEGVRRMAAVATGGLANEWTQGLATQLKGVDAAQAFVNAVSGGNESAVKEEARKLALAPIVELFDVNAMATSIEQKLRGQDLNGQLNQRIQKILSEKGLNTSIDAISQVAQGTQEVANTATTSVGTIGVGAEVAGEKVKAAFDGALPSIDILIARLNLMNGVIERVGVTSQLTAGKIAGLNPPGLPGANGNGVPTDAQKAMGGPSPL